MKPVSPHDLLSAYLDGELAPREREEVERLLAESKEARQELSELKKVGELLRQIPREALPPTFASQVLDVCLSETGEFDSTTLTELPTSEKVGPKSSPAAPQTKTKRRRWFRAAGLTAALATLAGILIIVLPGSPEINHTEMAHHPSADQSVEAERNFSDDHPADRQNQPLAAEGARPDDARNEAGIPQDGDMADAQSRGKHSNREFSDQTKSLAAPAEVDAVPQSADEMERELSVAAAEKSRSSGNQQSPRVAVVKIRVPDRRRGLKDLQSLLERHQIPTGASRNDQRSKDGENHLAVYVEADSDRFAAAMDDLKNQPAFRDLTWDSPVAMAQIQPMLSASKKGGRTFQKGRAMSFGASGAAAPKNLRIEAPENDLKSPRRLRAEKSAPQKKSPGKPGEKKADMADDRSPSSPPAAKAEPAPTPEAAEAKPKKSPAPRITATDSIRPDKQRPQRAPMQRLQTDAKPAEPKDAEPAKRKANETPRSRQQEFKLSQPLLKRLQDSAAEGGRFRQKPSNESKQDPPASNRGRVQVVFVLVDQNEPSENAPAVDKSAPDTE